MNLGVSAVYTAKTNAYANMNPASKQNVSFGWGKVESTDTEIYLANKNTQLETKNTQLEEENTQLRNRVIELEAKNKDSDARCLRAYNIIFSQDKLIYNSDSQ